jgi:hypothetical protein
MRNVAQNEAVRLFLRKNDPTQLGASMDSVSLVTPTIGEQATGPHVAMGRNGPALTWRSTAALRKLVVIREPAPGC